MGPDIGGVIKTVAARLVSRATTFDGIISKR
jgi:hypothetical protein